MRWTIPLLLALAPLQPLAADSGDRLNYVYFADGSGNSSISTSAWQDYQRAKQVRGERGPLLYLRDGGAAYIIRDPAVLARAAEIFRPQRELGRRQSALGTQQGELGRRQGALGAEQGRLGARMAGATAARMGELGRQQGELGRRQGELGSQQAALGQRQAALGREQARLAEAARPQLRALLTDALRRGVAQKVD